VSLPVTEITVAAGSDPAVALRAAAPDRMDLSRAPLLHLMTAAEPGGGWLILLQMHHLVLDHEGLEMVLGEVRAIQAGHGQSLAEPLPFRDFVAQARLGVPRREHERYFHELVGDVSGPAAPYGLVDVRDPGRARRARLPVGTGLGGRLRGLARARSVSPATIVHLAWARLLMVLTGRDDVVFGTVLLGRMNAGAGADRVPGLYMNTLPVRVAHPQTPAGQALEALRSQLAALLAHEHAPLVLAQQASAVPPGLPLFTTLLNYRHTQPPTPGTRGRNGGVQIIGGQERSNYPLDISVDDWGTGLGVAVTATEPADPGQLCTLLCTCLDSLVTALETDPATPLRAVSVLGSGERSQLVDGWGGVGGPAGDVAVASLLAGRVAGAPDAVAVVCGDAVVSYGELDRRASLLAGRLAGWCGGGEPVVAVLADRSAELVVALVAVLKAGAAYLPVHPGTPPRRVAWMLADAGVTVVLCDGDRELPADVARLPLTGGADDPDAPAPAPAPAPGPGPGPGPGLGPAGGHPDRLAYVMYTSGSTGAPKGVAVRHRDVVTLAADRGWAGTAHRRVLMHSTPAFDASTYELWVPLLSGGTVVIEPGEPDLDRLAALITAQRVSGLFLTTALFNLLAAEQPQALAGTEVVLTGGEAASPAAMRRVLLSCPQTVLGHVYGPTETTTFATRSLRADPGRVADPPPIGTPLDGTRAYVLDRWLEPVPAGTAGELYLAGAGLARGYLHQPALTSERFTACPFTAPGQRMYRTGDLARWTPDAELVFAGRADDQVKIRGFRIEPAEIETTLTASPHVTQAVVTIREDTPGDKRLTAYIVPAGISRNADDLAMTIRDYAASQLPDYMLPTITLLETLPLTPNGKIDRTALSTEDFAGPTLAHHASWAVQLEKTLCETFAEVLGVDQVGVEDQFFALGGHSLLAMQLVKQLRTRGVSISVRDLMSAPTVRGVMDRLSLSSVQDSLSVLLPIRATGDGPVLFCVHPAGGLGWGYMPLARYVPDSFRIYGVQARALDGTSQYPGSVREMAADYIEQIKTIQPVGPYHLLGHSFGGTIAYEMAVQLHQHGDDIAALIIGDAYPPMPPVPETSEPDPGQRPPDQEETRARPLDLVRREAGNVLGAISEEELLLLAEIFNNSAVLSNTHEPSHFDGDMLLLVAPVGREPGRTGASFWEGYVSGNITEVHLPCSHMDLLLPEMLGEAWSAVSAWLELDE
jgi:amino acid adenylation domain-containing protein